MKVLFYRYNSICEPDLIATFKEFGFEVEELTLEMERKDVYPLEQVNAVKGKLDMHPADFVFSVNFFPMLSEVCNIYHVRYISWIVDAPVLELYASAITNEWNRTFIFDRALYEEIAPLNPECVFYLPLGARIQEKEQLFVSGAEREYIHDIAFVGSLYSEKDPFLPAIGRIPERLRGYLDGIMRAQQQVYGLYFIEDLLSDEDVEEVAASWPDICRPAEDSFLTMKRMLAQYYIGNHITALERKETFRVLSEHFSADIYTGSDTGALPRLKNHGRAKTLTQMPRIFHHSKININTTSKGIRTGLPLRIFDILSCGGFVLSNYQPELDGLFAIGEDMAVYTSMEELQAKAEYYLSHEKERAEMAACGYAALKKNYTYEIQMGKMMLAAYEH